MKTLESKYICGYLSHGLKMFYKGEVYPCYGVNISDDLFCGGHGNLDWWGISFVRPILRPLSDLCRPISHNGKEIIPIVELAKIAEPNYVWKINKKMAIREIVYETWTDKVYFGYTGLHRYFKFTERDDRYFYSVYKDDNMEYIPDQIPLFDYLHELKIDYRGLIDAGLAIDANTLENNPYK
jgi:hypothetical protein